MPKTLTARTVARLQPADDPYYVADALITGLAIRVALDGSKSWSLRYRIGRRMRRLTLGSYPTPLSLADARKRAKDELKLVNKGVDPAEVKAERRTADTVDDFAKTFVDDYLKPKNKSWKGAERYLRREILPKWKHRAMKEITTYDVQTLLKAIAKRPAPIAANRVRALLSKMFNEAIKHDARTGRPSPIVLNPVLAAARPGTEQQRDRVLTHDEIRELWKACDAMAPEMAAAWKLRLITAQRAAEVHDATWDELDLSDGWWTIPKERAKNKLSHRVPLSAMALEILTALRTQQDEQLKKRRAKDPDAKSETFVLAGARGKKQQADAAATFGIPDFTGHDLRRTAASLMTGSGTSRLVVSKILNHKEKHITAVYDRHGYDAEKRIALDQWARTLTAIIEKQEGANVVAFARS